LFKVLNPGFVRVVVVSGKILKKIKDFTNRKTFVSVQFNKQEGKTSKRDDMISPVWDEG
jgi:hypothetical protein